METRPSQRRRRRRMSWRDGPRHAAELSRSIEPSDLDELKLPNGFRFDFIAKWDEDLGSKGPLGAEKFGFNNDFLAYFPINALGTGAPNSDEGCSGSTMSIPTRCS